MTELWLKFDGKRIPVDRESFIVGRHSESDLSIADGRLSRQHLKIERFGDVFAASDLGSSNGAKINGTRLDKPTTLRNGDLLNLGGLEISVEISAGGFSRYDSFDSFGDAEEAAPEKSPAELPEAAAIAVPPSAKPAAPKGPNVAPSNPGSVPKALFFIAPVCAVIVVAMVIGAVLIYGRKTEVVKNEGGFIYSNDNEGAPGGNGEDDPETPGAGKKNTPAPTPGKSDPGNSTAPPGGTSLPTDSPEVPTPAPKNQPDTAKIEMNSAPFLRKIAQNDPKMFLTSEQAQAIIGKIKQFSNSAELADNIKSARANASQIQSLANTRNLKPQFVAVAALAKMGSSRGNVLQTAQGMAEVLDKLSIQLGNELADDCLLTIAVYDQGVAGDFLKTRNMLQDLSNKFPESSRTIRTIWFLRKNNKITDAEFDFALRFLAIGTITQNPKDFGVNAEELKLN